MPCYSPNFISYNCVDKFTGMIETKFVGRKMLLKGTVRDILSESYSGNSKQWFDDYDGDHSKLVPIACGKCIGCRLDYARSWADRMTYHQLDSKSPSYFLTLTYDDSYIDDLEVKDGLHTLRYDDMRDFIVKLRNKFRSCDIDYYYSGEYGGVTFRPHYHAVFYGFELPDLKFWKMNDNGDPIYTSDLLMDLWKYGFVTVSNFTWSTAAYVAKYVTKKLNGHMKCEYDYFDLVVEKSFCSRRPGIANSYYLDHFDEIWVQEGKAVDRLVNSSGHLGIPRYFRKLATKDGYRSPGYEQYREYMQRCVERRNLLNPLTLENSSFDLQNVERLLQFNEREVLSQINSRKL